MDWLATLDRAGYDIGLMGNFMRMPHGMRKGRRPRAPKKYAREAAAARRIQLELLLYPIYHVSIQ